MLKPRLNWLLVFVPFSAIADFGLHNETLTFVTAALAIIPLAGQIGHATDELSLHVGPRLGGVLNATLGNVAELIIGLFLIFKNEFEVLKASLTGSIIGNLLLVLGLALFAGGLKRDEQEFDSRAATMHSTSLTLAVIAMLMPALFVHSTATDTHVQREVVSVIVGIALIALYAAALVFMLSTHKHLFRTPETDEKPTWPIRKAVTMLGVAAALVAFESEMLVGALEPTVKSLGLTKFFVGLIIVPVVGNAAEHSSAVVFALRNKLDVTLEIAIGSSTQIALLVAPLLVLISLAAGHPMDFVFTVFEIAAVGLSTFIVDMIVHDGRSNWLEGAQLVGAYIVMAVSFFFLK